MSNVASLKAALRKIARSNLEANRPFRAEKSSLIWNRLASLDVFNLARKSSNLMSYADFQDEVQTTRFFFHEPRAVPTRPLLPGAQPPALAGQTLALAGQTPALAGQTLALAGQTPALAGQPPALVGQTPALAGQTPALIVPYCENGDIVPFRLQTLDELEPGCMGIPEPKKLLRKEPGRIVDSRTIELVLVPGLAFDASGHRLGRGAGYYDRFLARLHPSTILIGLAFECQIFESVPTEPYDKPVDFVVTEGHL